MVFQPSSLQGGLHKKLKQSVHVAGEKGEKVRLPSVNSKVDSIKTHGPGGREGILQRGFQRRALPLHIIAPATRDLQGVRNSYEKNKKLIPKEVRI